MPGVPFGGGDNSHKLELPLVPTSSLRHSAAPSLLISETFTSIQGEGKLAGIPSFFIRTSGCNLRCAWCDTPYASWSPEGEPLSTTDLVEKALASCVRHVVLTGGEPMIFPQTPALCEALRAAGFHITIETAGTVFHQVACDLMSISPKLRNSTPREGDPRDPKGLWRERHEQRRLNLDALQNLLDTHPARQLKFVVAEEADLGEIDALLARLRGWKPDDVLLMPEGITLPAPERKVWMVRECIARNWRYCPRLHIELFGNTRGT